MRVVDPHHHPQQRGDPGQRQRDCGKARSKHAQADSHPGGQGGVVAGEGPVPRAGALRDEFGPGAQRAARPLLVHHQLHRFAHRVGRDGAEPGQHGCGDPSCISTTDCRPPHPGQQHSQNHQRALGGCFQERAQPRRRVRHRLCHRPVPRRRRSARDLDGTGFTQPARRKPDDRTRPHTQDAPSSKQPTSSVVPSRFLFHGD